MRIFSACRLKLKRSGRCLTKLSVTLTCNSVYATVEFSCAVIFAVEWNAFVYNVLFWTVHLRFDWFLMPVAVCHILHRALYWSSCSRYVHKNQWNTWSSGYIVCAGVMKFCSNVGLAKIRRREKFGHKPPKMAKFDPVAMRFAPQWWSFMAKWGQ
jgi:hypothetical protein